MPELLNNGEGACAATAKSLCSSGHVLVLDFGSQYSRLIVRRLREIGVYSEIQRCDIPLSDIEKFHPAAIVLSGGPSSVYEKGSPHVASSFFEWAERQKVPLLGICYGLQEMTYVLGGEVKSGSKREFGSTWVTIHRDDGIVDAAAARDASAASAARSRGGDAAGNDAAGGGEERNGGSAAPCQRPQKCIAPLTATAESVKTGAAVCYGLATEMPAEEGGAAAGGAGEGAVVGGVAAALQEGESAATQQVPTHCALFDGCGEKVCEAEDEKTSGEQQPARKKQKKEGDMLVWMSHGDKVTRLPPGFKVLASTSSCPNAAVGDPKRRFYGLQFHPEVTHTPEGAVLLRNFVIRIAGLQPTWTMKNFLHAEIKSIRARVGEEALVLGAVSGGVDSTVAAALVHRAVGKRFKGVLIDTGLLRQNEAKDTVKALQTIFSGASVECVDASAAFLSALKGVQDPEEKRKIIGRLFVEQFEKYVKEVKIPVESTFLLQGTLYPDVIESRSYKGPSHTIKTHHNVGGLPEKMHMKILEPLRELFKDEVRALGVELGLPHDRVYRHPFPGPGLAVRIVGDITLQRVHVLQRADAIFIDEIKKGGLYNQIAQAFVVLLPGAPSVGVMGDCRTYEWTCALRAVETADFMTADWSRLPYELVARVSSRIINEVRGVNRVVMDVCSKPPATIEWE